MNFNNIYIKSEPLAVKKSKMIASVLYGMLILGSISYKVTAQDIQYSQFYANPLYLNPAFTGTAEVSRVMVNYRNQWPGINQSISSFSAGFDTYLPNFNSGLGLVLNKSQQSHTHLSITEIGTTYAYSARLSDISYLRLGMQVSYVDRDANFGNLLFGSQIDHSGNISDFSGENLGIDIRHQYINYSTGLLYYSHSVWLGLSLHHLSQPNISYLEGQISQLPMKFSAHGGINFQLMGPANPWLEKRELILAFNYKNQRPFQQADLGAQLNIHPLVVGLWYRGIPVKKMGNRKNESIIALVGVSLGAELNLGYSYDYTISTLCNATSAGAHEISIQYTFQGSLKAGRRKSSMPCFKY